MESHQTVGQVRGMFNGDRARKQNPSGITASNAFERWTMNGSSRNSSTASNRWCTSRQTPGPMSSPRGAGDRARGYCPTAWGPRQKFVTVKGQVWMTAGRDSRARGEEREQCCNYVPKRQWGPRICPRISEIGRRLCRDRSEVENADRIQKSCGLGARGNLTLIGINLLREGLGLAGSVAGGPFLDGQRGSAKAHPDVADPDDGPRQAHRGAGILITLDPANDSMI